jgi:4-hydroxybenzoate polyprenyltransferase
MQKQKISWHTFSELTKFEQTLFGLPFTLSGVLMPLYLAPLNQWLSFRLLWILPAFIAARLSGMAFNQWLDKDIDAENPRTQARLLPSKRVEEKTVAALAISLLMLFLGCCYAIHPTCFLGGLLAAFLIAIYSFTKRFTWLCHFFLGAIHFLGPVMASVAVSSTVTASSLLLGLIAGLTLAASDIFYAFQDFYFDRSRGIFSIPARFGLAHAYKIASRLQMGAAMGFVFLIMNLNLSFPFYLAPMGLLILFIDFQLKVRPIIERPNEAFKIAPLFFKINVSVALIVMLTLCIGLI